MVSGSTKNRIKGRATQAKGKAKELAGDATGNDRLKTSGEGDRAKGKAQAMAGDAGNAAKRLVRKAKGKD